jgi:DNA-binding IclR family transcriptional regulator
MPPSRNTRDVSTELLKVLGLLSRRARPAADIAATMGFDLQRAERLLVALTLLGLIDEDHRLTAAGTAELAAGKRAVRQVAVTLQPSSDPYYPSSMR